MMSILTHYFAKALNYHD